MPDRPRVIIPDWLIAVLLFVLTVGVFARVAPNDFIGYDDPDYVTSNRHVRQGLTRESVRWAFTTTDAANWHPLTWLSHMLDVQLFGLHPAAHHLVNVVLHATSAVLLFVALRKLTRGGDAVVDGADAIAEQEQDGIRASNAADSRWAAAFVACVFAVHPLRVESVAWAAECKDVLAALFWVLTLIAYAHYARRPTWPRYLLVFLALALGLMAKPMLVSLPLVLLLLDYWPLRRSAGARSPFARWRKLVEEKFVLFLLVLASSIVTFWAQQTGGAVVKAEAFPISARIANSSLGYARYLGKLVWPTHLAVFYPRAASIPPWQWVAAAIALALVTIGSIAFARRLPYLFVGWFWYLVTLVPVIGLVQVGSQAIADRYTYLPLIGPTIALAWGARDLARRAPSIRMALAPLAAACVITMAALTWRQIGFWRDTYTLFAHALDVTDRNHIAHGYVGTELGKQDHPDEAVQHFRQALEINPNYAEGHYNLANHLYRAGDLGGAMEHYQLAVQLNPKLADADYMIGVLWLKQGRLPLAIESFNTALSKRPEYGEAETGLGYALMDSGQPDLAVLHFTRALQLQPEYATARQGMHQALSLLRAKQQQQQLPSTKLSR